MTLKDSYISTYLIEVRISELWYLNKFSISPNVIPTLVGVVGE